MTAALRNVSKRCGPFPALRQCSLEVAPQEIVVLRGPNGSGKSTILRILAQLDSADSGEVETLPCGYMGHVPSLFPDFTVEENLSSVAQLRGDSPEQAIRELHLSSLLPRTVRSLSRGQLQRVMLAAAVLGPSSQLLILDEPTTGLDDRSIALLPSLLSAWLLRFTNRRVILATHEQSPRSWLPHEAPMRELVLRAGSVVA